MLVCPACRETNPEDVSVCEHCGADMKPGVALRARPTGPPPDVDIPPPKESPRWVPMTVFALIVVGIGALGGWLAIRPQPCDGKFSSSQFSYCVDVPRGWTQSSATIGSVPVDQFAHEGSTAVVMSVPLRPGATVNTYAELARDQALQRGVRPGPVQPIRLDGQPALQWTIEAAEDASFRGVEVVTVVDDTGWTVQLDDDVSSFGDDVGTFRSMLASWHFR